MMSAETREGACRGLAIGFGVVLLAFEVIQHLGNPYRWPWQVTAADVLAVAMLWYGAWRSPRVLTGGWGFACALLYVAVLISWIGRWPPLTLAALVALLTLSIVGFVFSLFPIPQGSPAASDSGAKSANEQGPAPLH